MALCQSVGRLLLAAFSCERRVAALTTYYLTVSRIAYRLRLRHTHEECFEHGRPGDLGVSQPQHCSRATTTYSAFVILSVCEMSPRYGYWFRDFIHGGASDTGPGGR